MIHSCDSVLPSRFGTARSNTLEWIDSLANTLLVYGTALALSCESTRNTWWEINAADLHLPDPGSEAMLRILLLLLIWTILAMSWSLCAIFLATAAVSVPAIASVSVSRQVQLGSHHFFVPPIAVASFDSWTSDLSPGTDDLIPLTIVHLNDTPSASAVTTALSNFEANDDVWQRLFAQGERRDRSAMDNWENGR